MQILLVAMHLVQRSFMLWNEFEDKLYKLQLKVFTLILCF